MAAISADASKPNTPFVVIGSGGFLRVCDSDTELGRASLYSLARGFFHGLKGYDAQGQRWAVAEVIAPYKVNFWTRLLANTIYNPKFTVILRWSRDGDYKLAELQEAIGRVVDGDDDLLTQFIPADRLKKIVRLCESHEQIVGKLRKHRVA